MLDKPQTFTYWFHKLKHLSLLNFLYFEDILKRYFIKVLPDQVHLGVCLSVVMWKENKRKRK